VPGVVPVKPEPMRTGALAVPGVTPPDLAALEEGAAPGVVAVLLSCDSVVAQP
jgi:hypothetical protein